MKILCTFPGRNGDLLWALPTIRAISQHYGVSVDLQIAGEFTGIVPLLQQQPYLATVTADARWSLTPPDEWRAPDFNQPYDHVYHCGYRGWPDEPLPAWVETGVKDTYRELGTLRVDYETPWIRSRSLAHYPYQFDIVSGWSDEWFELKWGVINLLPPKFQTDLALIVPPGSRWDTEANGLPIYPTGWEQAAAWILGCGVFLGCCSALHVLACAMGKPVVVMEPSPARHNPIFYPFGTDGRIKVVKGLDGHFTHDARHVAETLEAVLCRTTP